MDKEHFEATLQATFFGDKNAFNLCLKEYKNLRQALNEIKKYIHSEEFFLLMNSNSMNDKNKPVCEDYFKVQGKLDNILDKVLEEEK